MVTAQARVPAMACVGGPAAGRGARRRRDLWRSSSASRVAVTSKPLRPVEKFGLPRSKEQRASLLLPNLGRRSGTTDTQTHKKANPKMARRQNEAVGNTGARAILTRAVNL